MKVGLRARWGGTTAYPTDGGRLYSIGSTRIHVDGGLGFFSGSREAPGSSLTRQPSLFEIREEFSQTKCWNYRIWWNGRFLMPSVDESVDAVISVPVHGMAGSTTGGSTEWRRGH